MGGGRACIGFKFSQLEMSTHVCNLSMLPLEVESLTRNSNFHVGPCRNCPVPSPRQIQVRSAKEQRDILVDERVHRSNRKWGPKASTAIDGQFGYLILQKEYSLPSSLFSLY